MVKIPLTNEDIIKRLVCKEIPDGRELQRKRIDLIGKAQEGRAYAISPQEAKKTKRIFTLTKEKLLKIYHKVIPLSLDLEDYDSYFFRWGKNGAVHLTTDEKLNELEGVLRDNDIPREYTRGDKLFDGSEEPTPGIIVPYRWSRNGALIVHKFLVCEDRLQAFPYWYLEETVTKEKEFSKEDNIVRDRFEIRSITERKRVYHSSAMFCKSGEANEALWPRNYLPKMLAKREIKYRKNWDKSRDPKLARIKFRLLGTDRSVTVYDPKWIVKS